MYNMTMNNTIVALTPHGIVNPQFEQLEASLQPLKGQLEAVIERTLLINEQTELIRAGYAVLDDILSQVLTC